MWVWRWWRYLLLYAGLNIVLLYVYQLPIEFSGIMQSIAGFIGLYKISSHAEWSEICSSFSLLFFYIMVSRSCWVKISTWFIFWKFTLRSELIISHSCTFRVSQFSPLANVVFFPLFLPCFFFFGVKNLELFIQIHFEP